MTGQPPAPQPPAPPPALPPPGFGPAGAPSSSWGSPSASWAPPKATGPAQGVTYASAGARLGAFIIDWIIVGLVIGASFLLLFSLLFASAATQSPGAFFAFFALFPLLILGQYLVQGLYFGVSWYRGGATPGMRIVGIKVVRSVDGGPLTKQQALLRTLGYWVSSAVMYLGFIWILIDDRRQGWHDKIADTLVIEGR